MLILSIKTDQAMAELSLYNNQTLLDEIIWEADRKLVETIHLMTKQLLETNHVTWQDLDGLICFGGPGSFTGLRIGLSVANALAYGLNIPIVTGKTKQWQTQAISRLLKGENDTIAIPEYGGELYITKSKK